MKKLLALIKSEVDVARLLEIQQTAEAQDVAATKMAEVVAAANLLKKVRPNINP